jgi:NAD(P)-dependent dehydrogenase (short-subunit alcohol dehydrogenase family)
MNRFLLNSKIVIITGGAGLLGEMHAEAILEAGGLPILLDISEEKLVGASRRLGEKFKKSIPYYVCDITNLDEIKKCDNEIFQKHGSVYGLINNAANNPKVGGKGLKNQDTRFENFSYEVWDRDLNVGLRGAFFCCQVFGPRMKNNGKGVIINVASDLALIAPNQKLYEQAGLSAEEQPVKPVTYSVVKTGLLGLTKYLSTYWARDGIRVNSISPGGVFNNQNKEFLERVEEMIPLGRMANKEEYKGGIIFLLSEASSYMQGSNLILDGGRSVW